MDAKSSLHAALYRVFRILVYADDEELKQYDMEQDLRKEQEQLEQAHLKHDDDADDNDTDDTENGARSLMDNNHNNNNNDDDVRQKKETNHNDDDDDNTVGVLSRVDTIIICMGTWHFTTEQCNAGGERNANGNTTTLGQQTELIQLLSEEFVSKRNYTVVWRTTPYCSGKAKNGTRVGYADTDWYSEQAMNTMDDIRRRSRGTSVNTRRSSGSGGGSRSIQYVDFGGAIRPRSFGPDRIEGDMNAHYGSQARLVLLQMITNRLQEHEEER
eukprot:CAMPEP_0116553630 /NCGR_PEP_ID=MMETSP0397-20121206/7153_1 /TAXON_ID=216820 /ORGANISM="Cyclophora tenuis, Strain ECT3854" /LENGTH=270 /DNA_ID=CAMNT_0004078721 /DNA_START=43 /DNA_END=855 /DNA_ORIENTATION=-